MLNMNWFFGLVFLGTAWSLVPVEEAKYPDLVPVEEAKSPGSDHLPSFELIESVLRSSFENVSRTYLLGGGVSSRLTYDKGEGDTMAQEPMSYLHHGIHAPNKESWKLACVFEAMSNAARHLRQIVPSSIKSETLRDLIEVSGVCSNMANTNCDADFDVITCDPYYEYRTMNGTCNNLQNPRWGAAPEPFERYLQADYGDGVMSFRTSRNGRELPSPRSISRVLSNSIERKKPTISLLVMQWGQFIDHDVTFTPEREHHEPVDGSKALMCCDHGNYDNSERLGTDCVPIDVEGDSYYKMDNRTCIRFIRSMPATRGCSFTPMEQINQITAFVDGSQVYGSTEEISNYVRRFRRGLLNVTDHPGNGQPLPPRGGRGFAHQCPFPESMGDCYLAGDKRVDEMPGLTAMHTTFIRLHNIIAESLRDQNPHWRNDEKLFQETRRIVTALIQQITYRDWLPHVLGPTLMEELDLGTGTTGYRDTYNPNVNPTIRNVFATAAFRFGHTLLTDFVKAATKETTLPLEGHFFNITVVQSDGTAPSSLLKGLARCPASPIDGFVANTFTDKLFATPREGDGRFFGLDLVSLNIQRGRDHGIPSYRKWRQFCGLRDINSLRKLETVMEKELARALSRVYGGINDVDIFPAGLSEFPIDDGLLGPTFSCILARQFAQIKHGDRFWYEREHQPKPFTPAQLSAIRSQGLASIMCRVSNHTQFRFQPDPFLVDGYPGNAAMDCSNYHFIDLLPWTEPRKNNDYYGSGTSIGSVNSSLAYEEK